MYLHASNIVFSMSMWLSCSYFSALSFNDAGTIILLPFMVISSIILISTLNYQYGCSSLVPKLLLMTSCRVHILTECLGVHHLGLSLLFLLWSSSQVCKCMTLLHWGLAHTWYFLSLFFHGCVGIVNLQWIDVVQACTELFCCIDGFIIVFFAACVTGLQHLS